METAETQAEKLRKEAEETWENMDYHDFKLWKEEYAESGNDISDSAHTSREMEEMFIEEYIEVNWVGE